MLRVGEKSHELGAAKCRPLARNYLIEVISGFAHAVYVRWGLGEFPEYLVLFKDEGDVQQL